jgi:membrane protein
MTRGRSAETPTGIPSTGWKDIAFRVKDEITEDRVSLIAAGVAFYGMLALFPAITAVLAIGGWLVAPEQIIEASQSLAPFVPEAVMKIITDQATEVASAQSNTLGLAALFAGAVALYSASKGMSSLMDGMNVAYDETETRGFVARYGVQLGLTLFLMFGLIVSLGVLMATPALISIVDAQPLVETGLTILAWLVLFGLTVIGLAALYRYGPSRDNPEFKWVSVGAVGACLLWIAGSAGFAFYVANFGSYNESFGALAGVVILLMWFWISAFIIILGAEINAEMEAQTRHDTTVGQDVPMGQRDAQKADRLGETQAT